MLVRAAVQEGEGGRQVLAALGLSAFGISMTLDEVFKTAGEVRQRVDEFADLLVPFRVETLQLRSKGEGGLEGERLGIDARTGGLYLAKPFGHLIGDAGRVDFIRNQRKLDDGSGDAGSNGLVGHGPR